MDRPLFGSASKSMRERLKSHARILCAVCVLAALLMLAWIQSSSAAQPQEETQEVFFSMLFPHLIPEAFRAIMTAAEAVLL